MDELFASVLLASLVGGMLLLFTGVMMVAAILFAVAFVVLIGPVIVGFVRGVRSALREK